MKDPCLSGLQEILAERKLHRLVAPDDPYHGIYQSLGACRGFGLPGSLFEEFFKIAALLRVDRKRLC